MPTYEDLRSDINRGRAAKFREEGARNNVTGFETGGDLRRKANAIVHADPGEARNKTSDVKAISKAIKDFKKTQN